MKQTAVGWLAIEYNRIDNKWKNVGQGQKHCAIEKAEALKQAKEMEKEKLKKAYSMGRLNKSIQEFNETFKSE